MRYVISSTECVWWSSILAVGVGVQLRLLSDLLESTFDISSVATAMKEDLWQRYVLYVCTYMYVVSLTDVCLHVPVYVTTHTTSDELQKQMAQARCVMLCC